MPKVLTVRSPWAWAIIHGGKGVENRSRRTTHRGELYIHAGLGWSQDGLEALKARGLPVGEAYAAAGMVIGTVDLVSVHHADECENSCSTWALPGRYHWLLENRKPLAHPFAATGRLGLWNLPEGEVR